MVSISRIAAATERLEHLIGSREDGARYLPLLRRLRTELAARDDDAAELERLRTRAAQRRAA